MIIDTEYSNHITAEEGYYLVNNDNIACTDAWLGCHDSVDNWHEVLIEDYVPTPIDDGIEKHKATQMEQFVLDGIISEYQYMQMTGLEFDIRAIEQE